MPLARLVLGTFASLGFGALAWSCSSYDGEETHASAVDASPESAPAPQPAAQTQALAIEVSPPEVELLAGSKAKFHVAVRSDSALGAPVKLSLAAKPTPSGASPLGTDQQQVELSQDLPEGDIELHADAAALHGRYSVALVATSVSKDGAALQAETAVLGRVVGTPGTLDTGFGEGKGYFDFCHDAATQNCGPGDLFIYPDGKMLVVGGSLPKAGGSQDTFLAARFMADGALDASFGQNGTKTSSIEVNSRQRAELTRLADGSFIVAFPASSYLSLAHMTENGEMDPQWGEAGKLNTDIISGGGDGIGPRVAVVEKGFVVAGSMLDAGTNKAVLRLYDVDGRVQTGFGTGGTASFRLTVSTRLGAIAVDAGGVIFVGGEDHDTGQTSTRAFVAAFDATGQVMSAYGETYYGSCGSLAAGCSISDTANTLSDSVSGLVPQKDGFLAYGTTNGFSPLKATPRLFHFARADGRISPSFAGDGMLEVDFGREVSAGALVVQPDNAFLVTPAFAPTFGLRRFKADATVDDGFGTAGVAQPVDGSSRRMALTENGRQLVVIGSDRDNTSIRIARYWLR